MLAANLAADLDAWVRLLALHDIDDLADAEPDTMRFRLYHLPARLAGHARRHRLRIEATWPWANAPQLSGISAGQLVGRAVPRQGGLGSRTVNLPGRTVDHRPDHINGGSGTPLVLTDERDPW